MASLTQHRFHDLERDSGQTLVEAALILPVLFLILLGIFWFGRAFNILSTLERAAAEGIQVNTHQTCASCTPSNTAATDAQIVSAIVSALQADHLKPVNLTDYMPPFSCNAGTPPNCTTLQGVGICRGVPLTCGTTQCQSPPIACGANAELGVRVSLGYNFNSPFPLANLPGLTLHASAQSQPED
jgi:hypothetical protein